MRAEVREREKQGRRAEIHRGAERIGDAGELIGRHQSVLDHVRRQRSEHRARGDVFRVEKQNVGHVFDLLFNSMEREKTCLRFWNKPLSSTS